MFSRQKINLITIKITKKLFYIKLVHANKYIGTLRKRSERENIIIFFAFIV